MFSKALKSLVNNLNSSFTTIRVQGVPKRFISAQIVDDKYVIVQTDATTDKDSNATSAVGTMKFPSIWLRDNCNCAECFHHSSQSRRINWNNFNTKIKVQEITTDINKKQLNIKWSDQHASTYDLSWLKARNFDEKRRQSYLTDFYRPKTQHWRGADFQKILQNFDYTDVMQSDETLKLWLEALAVYGVAIIQNSPIDKKVVRNLAERVGFIRKTTYGEEFIVQSKPGAKNYAYLSDPLPLHTDLPYYEYKPSVNILHCMVQSKSEGGSNLLVDAFHIADRLLVEQPEAYRILTETLVDWNDIGSEEGKAFHNIWRAPVICLDKNGNYTRINHSVPQRDSHFSIPLEEVIPWYESYAKFVRLACEDAYAFKTKPGDVLTFNNIRLLHGRTGYDDTVDNVRYIVGAYLDWDIIYSKLRVLKTAANKNK